MGSSAPVLAPIEPDPAAVAAEQAASNADLQTQQTDFASQTSAFQRNFYGASATGAVNGMSSIALTPLGAVSGAK